MADLQEVVARYALVADIHANLAAFQKVRQDITAHSQSRKFDAIYCLGDLIGYGPSPNEVLEQALPFFDRIILGNHEIAVILNEYGWLNRLCQASLQWTHARLSPEHRQHLGDIFHNQKPSLILTSHGVSFHLSHAVPDPRSHCHLYANQFLNSISSLGKLFQQFQTQHLIVGHCHVPFCVTRNPDGNYRIFATSLKTVEGHLKGPQQQQALQRQKIILRRVFRGEVELKIKLHLAPDAIIPRLIKPKQRIVVSLPSGGGISRTNPDPRAGWTELLVHADRHVQLIFHRIEYDCIATYTALYKCGMPYALADKLIPYFFFWRFHPLKKQQKETV